MSACASAGPEALKAVSGLVLIFVLMRVWPLCSQNQWQLQPVSAMSDSRSRPVGPALRVFDAQPELLKGALVCDTIVGKAAAAIYILGGAAGVYAETMSVAAADFLIANGVDCACETKTEKLLNRQGTGLCPFEQAVLELERPEDCLPVIRATLARLMAGKNNK